MMPLYGFLEGDTIGLLILAHKTDTVPRRHIGRGAGNDFAARDADGDVIEAQHVLLPKTNAPSRIRRSRCRLVSMSEEGDDDRHLAAFCYQSHPFA